ncbi:MAG: YibE/F family protein [Candidatus Margulisiibacteriota bacterium]|nr:YibE/F family protein [Candidatus Margulisiibacteriota bacterium]
MSKRSAIWVLFIILVSLFGFSASAEELHPPLYEKATVMDVYTFDDRDITGGESQDVILKITSGKYKDKIVEVQHITSSMMGGQMVIKLGDKVILYIDEHPSKAESEDGSPVISIADYARDFPIYLLALLYAILLVVIGGIRGLKSLLSLIITICLIFLVLFPLTLWGFNPLLVSILLAGAVSVIVFLIIGGRSVKSFSAAIGTIIGVAIAGLLAYVVGNMVHLSGLSSEEARILLYSMELKINYQGLIFGSILIGALGAIMDVGMSIASVVEEVHKVHPKVNFRNLFDAGMNVGKDVMGTMSNTLILAYTGSALPLLLLLVANNMSFSKILNMEMIAVEAVRALAGSIGLVLCIPVTAFVSALMNSKRARLD